MRHISLLLWGEAWTDIFHLSVSARKLYKQIRPWDTLAYCCEVKQPTDIYHLSVAARYTI